MASINWSELKSRREEVKRRYSSIRKVPLVLATKRELIREVLGEIQGSVLDIGGSHGFLGELCKSAPAITEYKLMDIDPAVRRDYKSLEEIDRAFDAVFMLDVIEHLSLKEGADLLARSASLLNAGGAMVLTLPNNLHPTAFGGDVTHVTPYRYFELGALLLACGFTDLSISRVSAKKKTGHRIMAWLLAPVMRFMDVDFATGILVRAKKA